MYKKLPKISIVTPSFNQAEFLEATIQSILSQNYSNLEYIIIDGGSTDRSIEIIKKYEKYLHFWCSAPDRGQYDAINKGFSHSTGEIMGWLNSDDMYLPWVLKTVSSIMSELPQVEWLTTLLPSFLDWHGFCTGFWSISGYSKESFLGGSYLPGGRQSIGCIQQESTFWRRSLWCRAGSHLRTDLKLASDFDLWSRFFCHAELYGLGTPLGGFRIQSNQKSRQVEQYTIEAEDSLSTMRQQNSWKPNFSKIVSKRLIRVIPQIKKLTESLYGYSAKKIIRKNGDSPDGFWAIEEYRFL